MRGMMFTQNLGWSDNDVRSVGQHPTSRLLLLWLAQWAHPRQFRRGWDFGREFQNVTLKRILAATNSANADFGVWGSAKADKIVNQADKGGLLLVTWAALGHARLAAQLDDVVAVCSPSCRWRWGRLLWTSRILSPLSCSFCQVNIFVEPITMHHYSLLTGNILNRLGAV